MKNKAKKGAKKKGFDHNHPFQIYLYTVKKFCLSFYLNFSK